MRVEVLEARRPKPKVQGPIFKLHFLKKNRKTALSRVRVRHYNRYMSKFVSTLVYQSTNQFKIDMMIRNTILLNAICTILPVFLFGQWNQLGSEVEGEFAGDTFGYSTDLNDAGDVMIVGAFDNAVVSTNTLYPGHARVYSWNGTDWVQKGSDIDGTDDDWSGHTVAIDSSGNTVAITSVYGVNTLTYLSGLVRIYDWSGTDWIQRGTDIYGDGHPIILESFGRGLSLSADGNTVAIGGPGNIANGFRAGFAKVYSWNGTQWAQIGADILGDEDYDQIGFSLSLNANGKILIVGGIGAFGNGNHQKGQAKVYEFDGLNWVQLGNTIYGEFDGDEFGRSVSINDAGNVIAVGASGYEIMSSNLVCSAYAYEWNGTNWIQRGNTLLGEENINDFGKAVSLNASGDILAVSAPAYSTKGIVQLFEWSNSNWTQLGNDLEGENLSDIFGASLNLNAVGNRIAISAWGHGDRGQAKVFEFQSDAALNDNLHLNLIHIHPNPSSGLVYLSNIVAPLEIALLDLNGKKLIETMLTSNSSIDLSSLPSGIYYLRIQSSTGNQLEKIIKE